MRAHARWILGSIVLALAVAVVWWRSDRRAVDVETAVVVRGVFEETIVEDGRTRVRWHTDITAPVTGEWRPAERRVGDTVAARALLGTLAAAPADPSAARALAARLGVADADLGAARAGEAAAVAAQAESDRAVGRAERLGAAGGVTEEELDRIRTLAEARRRERDAAHARVTAALFARDAARAMLPGGGGVVRVTAPYDGVILRLDEEHARVVGAGAPLMMIGAMDGLEVVVDVLSTDAGRIPIGAPMSIVSGSDTAAAHVLRVEPVAKTVRSALGVDEQRVAVIGDIHRPGPRLGHDYEVRARIVIARREREILVPAGALVRDGDAWSVFVVDAKGRARHRSVTLRARGVEQAAVNGVVEGERVVLHPPETLSDGARITR